MGWRFNRRIKLFPGVTMNMGKSGSSFSFGPRGAKVTVGKNRDGWFMTFLKQYWWVILLVIVCGWLLIKIWIHK